MMNKATDAQLEQLSALADGELPRQAVGETLAAIDADPTVRQHWQSYHLVGEILRTGQHTACTDSGLFMARLNQRLAQDGIAQLTSSSRVDVNLHLTREQAANEPVFRWKWVAGLASVAAAAAVGWAWVGMGVEPQLAGQQLAEQAPSQGPARVAVSAGAAAPSQVASSASVQTRGLVGAGNPPIMLRDPRLDELLQAHQQTVGASQMPSMYLRSATFEGAAR